MFRVDIVRVSTSIDRFGSHVFKPGENLSLVGKLIGRRRHRAGSITALATLLQRLCKGFSRAFQRSFSGDIRGTASACHPCKLQARPRMLKSGAGVHFPDSRFPVEGFEGKRQGGRDGIVPAPHGSRSSSREGGLPGPACACRCVGRTQAGMTGRGRVPESTCWRPCCCGCRPGGTPRRCAPGRGRSTSSVTSPLEWTL